MRWLSDHRWAVLGFAIAVGNWPGMLAGAFVPRWAVIAVGVPLVSRLDWRQMRESMLGVLIFVLAAGAASLLRSPFPQAGGGDLVFIALLVMTAIAAAGLDSLDDVMAGLGVGLAVSAALAVPQFFRLWQPVAEIQPPAGLFYTSEVLGELAALVLVWAALRPRWTLAAAMLGTVLLTGSRVGLLTALIALACFRRPPWRWTFPLVLISVPGALWLLAFGKFAGAEHAIHRVTLWGATVLAFTPIGNGLGWGAAAFPIEEFVHSDALQAMAELGIFGLALAAIPVICLRNRRGTDAERALFVACCVEALVSFPLHFPASGFVAAVAAGYLAGGRAVVCLGDDQRQPDDVARGVRRRDAGRRDVGRGRGGSRPFPAGPLFARPARLCAPQPGAVSVNR